MSIKKESGTCIFFAFSHTRACYSDHPDLKIKFLSNTYSQAMQKQSAQYVEFGKSSNFTPLAKLIGHK